MNELRDRIALALELEKGGITDHPSPANEHWYFHNQVIDYDNEQVIVDQRISFEERLDNILSLVQEEVKKARIDENEFWIGVLDARRKLRTSIDYRNIVVDDLDERIAFLTDKKEE